MIARITYFIQKLLSLLRVHTIAAGLEVSDRVIRLAVFDGRVWQMHALRLEPDVLENGKIKNREALIAGFAALKAKLGKKGRAKKINVVLCMSSVEAYTQVFPLPMVHGQGLEEAVELNLQMASPLEEGQAYAGWQQVGRDEKTMNLEILSAFIERKVVDEMVDALFDAGFLVMAVESRAIALTRVLREKGAGVDAGKSYLFVNIDNSGIDFLIIRNGALYFEYTNSWHDMMDEKGEIAIPKFQTTLAASLRQVINFYNQHWAEPIGAIILSAVALEAEAEKVITTSAAIPTVKLTLVMGQPVSSEWLTALGCSLRGARLKAKSQEVNLLGSDSRDRFHEEQLLNFMRFWRVVVPVTLGILLATYCTVDFFLINTKTEIESRSDFNVGGGQSADISALQAAAASFNQSVAFMKVAEGMIHPKNIVLGLTADLAAKNHITINHFTFQSFAAPISISGTGVAQNEVLAFKVALEGDPRVHGVNLPLTGIQTNGSQVAFSLTFSFSP